MRGEGLIRSGGQGIPLHRDDAEAAFSPQSREGKQSCHTEQCCLDVTRQADGLSEELWGVEVTGARCARAEHQEMEGGVGVGAELAIHAKPRGQPLQGSK